MLTEDSTVDETGDVVTPRGIQKAPKGTIGG